MAQPAKLRISVVTLVFRLSKLGCARRFRTHPEWRLVNGAVKFAASSGMFVSPRKALTVSASFESLPDTQEVLDAARVLGELHAQPVQAAVAVLLLRISDSNPEGALRVSLCDLPGLDHVPAVGHRLARG